jgi:hypothetical protein
LPTAELPSTHLLGSEVFFNKAKRLAIFISKAEVQSLTSLLSGNQSKTSSEYISSLGRLI